MKLSVVVPVLNEEQVLPLTMSSLTSILAQIHWSYEIVAVDDGSTDRTLEVLQTLAAADDRIKVVSFSRNFGHQAAITAGMDFASGDAIVIIDADLQDPPELIPEMLEQHEKGYDVVSPQRVRRDGESWFKRTTAACFYWLMRKGVDSRLPAEVGDFRLLSRRVVVALRQCREHQRFMRGLVAWLGFSEIVIPFERRSRAAGETKYPLWKMVRFAWTAITSFSALPLRLSIVVGLMSSALAFAYFIWALYAAFIMKKVIQGWTSVVAFQAFSAGVILLSVGLIGEYIAKIYEESKQRPLYVIGALTNLDTNDVEEVLAGGARTPRLEQVGTGLRQR